MSKNYEKNPEKANYLKEKLLKHYPEVFEKYKWNKDLTQVQVCNLVEFLEKEEGIIPENREELARIFTVISPKEKKAIMINTSKKGKIPEGEFGKYDLEMQEFELTNEEIREKMREQIKRYAKEILLPAEEEKLIDQMVPEHLSQMEEFVEQGMDETEIEIRARKVVDRKVDEKNAGNGISKRQRQEVEREKRDNRVKKEPNEEISEKNQELPEDVVKAATKLGVTKVKGYFYVNAKQLADKVENTPVKEDGKRVLILEVANGNAIDGPDRYYGFQEERMVLWSNQNEEMEEVTQRGARPPVDGKLIEPLKRDDPTYVEFSSSEGMVVEEKLEENLNLSVQALESYKQEIEELLKHYAQNIVAIQENESLDDDQKRELLFQNSQNFERLNEQLAQKYGIDFCNVKTINLQKTEYHQEVEKEIEEEEEEEELDPHEEWWKNQRKMKQ